jgi:iron(III) transport system substrate-binding protein
MASRRFGGFLRAGWLLGVVLLALGCAGGSQPPGVAPVTGAQPSASSEWDAVVAAAKREGSVVLNGPPTADARDALTEGFQQKYPEISVEYDGQQGSAVPPKLLAEREAGLYRVDLIINGSTSQLDLIKAGAMAPIRPFLGGPETRDESVWLGGKLEFSDNAATHNLIFGHIVKAPLAYNPATVSPSEITSYQDLLNPRFKGRMVMYDPRTAGAGFTTASFFYLTPSLGKEYLRQLLGQQLVFSRDDRQIMDGVVRGTYDVAIAPGDKTVAEMQNRGVNVAIISPEQLREGSYLTAGVGAVGVVANTPHPNATKVYLDYLLSREGQLAFSKGVGYVSRRLDVPNDHLPNFLVPKPGIEYDGVYKEKYYDLRGEVQEFVAANAGSQ